MTDQSRALAADGTPYEHQPTEVVDSEQLVVGFTITDGTVPDDIVGTFRIRRLDSEQANEDFYTQDHTVVVIPANGQVVGRYGTGQLGVDFGEVLAKLFDNYAEVVIEAQARQALASFADFFESDDGEAVDFAEFAQALVAQAEADEQA